MVSSERPHPIFLVPRMTSLFGWRVLPAVALFLVAATAVDAGAQTCRGMPRGGGIALVRGDVYLGPTYGVALSKGIFGVGFNSLSGEAGNTAWDANLRFTLARGIGKFQVCPSLGLEYMNATSEFSDGSELTSRTGTAAAGVGLGFEQEVYNGISLIPFLALDYQFTAIAFSLDAPDDGESSLSGDTLSHVNIQYGGLAKYQSFYVGFSADRFSDTEGSRPYRARLFVGFAFGGASRSTRAAPLPRPPSVRTYDR
jgi:hypothetical protein